MPSQDILETWRLRTPNEYESLSHWGDIIMWRGHIYNIVINAFKNVADVAPQLHQLGYRDKASFAMVVFQASAPVSAHEMCTERLSIDNT